MMMMMMMAEISTSVPYNTIIVYVVGGGEGRVELACGYLI